MVVWGADFMRLSMSRMNPCMEPPIYHLFYLTIPSPADLIFFLLFFGDSWDTRARCYIWRKYLGLKVIRSNLCKKVPYRRLAFISHIGRWRWVKLKSRSRFDKNSKLCAYFNVSYLVHITLLVSSSSSSYNYHEPIASTSVVGNSCSVGNRWQRSKSWQLQVVGSDCSCGHWTTVVVVGRVGVGNRT